MSNNMPEKPEENQARIIHVWIYYDGLNVRLNDGRVIFVPLNWYPRLMEATNEERKKMSYIGNGLGIHWDLLDEDVSLEGILKGNKSNESEKSFKEWQKRRKLIKCKLEEL